VKTRILIPLMKLTRISIGGTSSQRPVISFYTSISRKRRYEEPTRIMKNEPLPPARRDSAVLMASRGSIAGDRNSWKDLACARAVVQRHAHARREARKTVGTRKTGGVIANGHRLRSPRARRGWLRRGSRGVGLPFSLSSMQSSFQRYTTTGKQRTWSLGPNV
jgi:hypothetical protein